MELRHDSNLELWISTRPRFLFSAQNTENKFVKFHSGPFWSVPPSTSPSCPFLFSNPYHPTPFHRTSGELRPTSGTNTRPFRSFGGLGRREGVKKERDLGTLGVDKIETTPSPRKKTRGWRLTWKGREGGWMRMTGSYPAPAVRTKTGRQEIRMSRGRGTRGGDR